MKSRALAKYLKISPQKLRLVANEIRGYPYREALALLRFMNKKGARFLSKLLQSAYANLVELKRSSAEQQVSDIITNESKVYIKTLQIDQGPITKRWMPRARGRSNQILKRSSNALLELAEEE